MTISEIPTTSSNWLDVPTSYAKLITSKLVTGYMAGYTVTCVYDLLNTQLDGRPGLNITSHQTGMACAAFVALTNLIYLGTNATTSISLSRLNETSIGYYRNAVTQIFSSCVSVSASLYAMRQMAPETTSNFLGLPKPLFIGMIPLYVGLNF